MKKLFKSALLVLALLGASTVTTSCDEETLNQILGMLFNPLLPLSDNGCKQLPKSIINRPFLAEILTVYFRLNGRLLGKWLAYKQSFVNVIDKLPYIVRDNLGGKTCSHIATEIVLSTVAITHNGNGKSILVNMTIGIVLTHFVRCLMALALAMKIKTPHGKSP